MYLSDDQISAEVTNITTWLTDTFRQTQKTRAVIAVSGGVDSGLALTLLTRALGAKNVWALLLPYGDQDMTDAKKMLDFNQIPSANRQLINIKLSVDQIAQSLGLPTSDEEKPNLDQTHKIRLGNVQARVRMIMVFDLAKKLDGLVCGTENKSENLLGYYTRFGDSASDLEPIAHLYKTQVYQLAKFLGLPDFVLTKAPSAGLWSGQTDEDQLGFSYAQADEVLQSLATSGGTQIDPSIVKKVADQVDSQKFKSFVPYKK